MTRGIKRCREVQRGVERYQKVSKRYQKVPGGTNICQEVSKDSKTFQEVHIISKRCQKVQRGAERYQEVPRGTMKC